MKNQGNGQPLGHVVHRERRGDEKPEARAPDSPKRNADPHALGEGVEGHHKHYKEHLRSGSSKGGLCAPCVA